MTLAKVRDKQTGNERTVTPKAYSIIPHRYILLGYVDEQGNPAEAPANVDRNNTAPEKKRNLAVERAAENKSGLTREDLDRMNAEAEQKVKDRQAETLTGNANSVELTIETEPVAKPEPVKKPKPVAKNKK